MAERPFALVHLLSPILYLSPLDKGDFRGGLNGNNPPRRCATAIPGGSIGHRRTRHTNHPRRGRWPGIPSSTEEGTLFSRAPTPLGARRDVDKKDVGCVALSDARSPFARGICPGCGAFRKRTHPTRSAFGIKEVTLSFSPGEILLWH